MKKTIKNILKLFKDIISIKQTASRLERQYNIMLSDQIRDQRIKLVIYGQEYNETYSYQKLKIHAEILRLKIAICQAINNNTNQVK